MGDSDFPKSALSYFNGGRILLLYDLYQMYSTLAFTKPVDRSVALLGLEKRLGRAFHTSADFGIVGRYFERTLLWQRDKSNQLTRIRYPADQRVPSWSWMSYIGVIEYLHIPFGETTWWQDIKLESRNSSLRPTDPHGVPELKVATARMTVSGIDLQRTIVRDNEDEYIDEASLRCVVVGKGMKKSKTNTESIYYVLVVKPSRDGSDSYERVGIGSLFSHHISTEDKIWTTLR